MIIYDKTLMTDVSVVGGKGIGLAKLFAYGFDVPDFFVIAVGTDIDDNRFASELDSFAAKLNCRRFAVRSSCVNEDTGEESFAGQFSTQLDVSRENLLQAVKGVILSCGNVRAKRYSEHFGTVSGEIAVVVQKQIHGDYSGVIFTSSPYNDEEIIVERVLGKGENLVSGIAAPEESRSFKKGVQPDEPEYARLLNAADKLEKMEGCPLDIEWTCCDNIVYFLQMRPLTAMGDCLPTIPDRQWEMYVYRDFCLFSHGIQRLASYPRVQEKLFGFSVPIAEGLIVNGREFYSPESDAAANEIWGKLDKNDFFDSFILKIKKCVAATRRRVNKLKNTDFGSMDKKQLFHAYRREITAYIKCYVPMMMRPDDYLYGKLIECVGEVGAEKIARAASVLSKKTYYAYEHRKFLSSVVNGDIASYLDEFEWIGSPLGKMCVAVDSEYFSRRAMSVTTSVAKEKLNELFSSHKKSLKFRNKIFSELNGEQEKKLFNLISEFVYLRTYTAENSDRYFYYIRKKILENIAGCIKIDMDVLLLMSPEELQSAENGFRLTEREISKRKSGEVVVISDGISSVYHTGQSYYLLKKLLPTVTADGSQVLEGKIACMGEVDARVRIINDMEQADSFETGCILVTTMTVPEITSAIEKAVGIITDEGGITCHAAIIAREYSVPCLVGTKNATSVLKDGMLVKLDCINGRVKIIENETVIYN